MVAESTQVGGCTAPSGVGRLARCPRRRGGGCWWRGVVVAVVAAAAAVGVVPAGAQEGSQSYGDVASDAYFAPAVAALESRGVFEGTECAEGFCPGRPLPRWQMAVWLVRALEEAQPQAAVSRFADVGGGVWWMPYTERLAELEITAGCRSEPPGYCPEQAVSRAQMASFLVRAFGLPAADPAGFVDVDPETNVHSDNIDRLAASEITTGCRTVPLEYCPAKSVTRAQMAAFIYRGLKWQESQTENNNQTQEQPEFITEENDLSRWAKHGMVDEYGEKWPWLKEAWDYTNQEDFKYVASDRNTISLRTLDPDETGDVFVQHKSYKLTISKVGVGHPRFLDILVHELAHIYTYSSGAAANPAPVAIGWLYFGSIEESCAGE